MAERDKTTNNEAQTAGASLPALSVDWALYDRYLEEADLSEAEKQAFLEALWSIIVGFVDLGFRLDPVQTACGQLASTAVPDACDARDLVELEHSNSRHEFTNAADGRSLPPAERSQR